MEKIDVYNKQKQKTGKIIERKRGAFLDKGEYIISVTAWIVNNDGKILLTQIKFEDGEVINAKYVTLNEFKEMIKNKEVQEYLNYFEDLYNEIY